MGTPVPRPLYQDALATARFGLSNRSSHNRFIHTRPGYQRTGSTALTDDVNGLGWHTRRRAFYNQQLFHDFRWVQEQATRLPSSPLSPRCYATRIPMATSQTSKPSASDSRRHDRTHSPDSFPNSRDVARARMQTMKEENKRLLKENADLRMRDEQVQKQEDDLRTERTRLQNEQSQHDASVARAQLAAKQNAAAAVQKDRDEIAAEKKRLQEKESKLSNQEREFLRYQSNERASMAEQRRRSEQKEKSATAIYENIRQEAYEAKKLQIEEHARRLEHRRQSQWRLEEEQVIQQAHKATVRREQDHRSTYRSYQLFWVDCLKHFELGKRQILQQQDDLNHVAEWWLRSKNDFAMASPADFEQNYPDLDARITDYFDRESAKARNNSTAMLRIEEAYDECLNQLGNSAHDHRHLTRSLRFQSPINSYDLSVLLVDLVGLAPFVARARSLRLKRTRIKRRLGQPSTAPGSSRALRAALLAADQELRVVSNTSSTIKSYRKLVALQSLKNDTPLEKEVFFSASDAEAVMAASGSEWTSHLQDCKGLNPLGVSENTIGKAEKAVKIAVADARDAIIKVKNARRKQLHLELRSRRRNNTENPEVEARLDQAIRDQTRVLESSRTMVPRAERDSERPRLVAASRATSRPLRITNTVASSFRETGKGRPIIETERRLYDLKRRLKTPPSGNTSEDQRTDRSELVNLKTEVRAHHIQRNTELKRQVGVPAPETSDSESVATKATPSRESLATISKHARSHRGRKRPRRVSFSFRPTPPLQAVLMAQIPDESAWRPTPVASGLDLRTLSRLANLELSRSSGPDGACRDTDEFRDPDDPEITTEEATIDFVSDSGSSYRPSQPNTSPQDDVVTTGTGRDNCFIKKGEARDDDTRELTYRISTEDYRKAAVASPSTSAAFWSHKLYKNAEGRSPAIHYCTSFEQAEAQAKHFLDEPVLGFDLEWEFGTRAEKSNIKRSVSLIQIASEDKIALFQIALYKGETIEELLPPSLRAVLESRSIIKAGVNVSGDGDRLEKALDVKVAGLFELSHLYSVVMYSENSIEKVNKRLHRLADQVHNALLLPLKKDDVRVSHWSKKLRMEQLEYAASDAYAGFQLYYALEARRRRLDPMPPRPALYEDDQPLVLGDGRVVKAQPARKKAKRVPQHGRTVDEDDDEDDECQEYFDAVETLDELEIQSQTTAGVPLSGISIVYPTLSPLEPSSSSKGSRQGPPPSLEIAEAESWVSSFRSSLPPEYILRSTHPALRAYALWHEQNLSCDAVASLLRDPPLKAQTVAGYILQAVKEEDLKYDTERVKGLFEILPKSAHGRFSKVVRQIGGL